MESRRAGDIDGINIEHAFRRLAKYAGVTNDSVLYGIASLVTAEFDEKQMRILFGFLLDIEERVTVRKRRPRKQYPPTPSTVAGNDGLRVPQPTKAPLVLKIIFQSPKSRRSSPQDASR
jgi:hypothetical protein